jgi:hypothetical protein
VIDLEVIAVHLIRRRLQCKNNNKGVGRVLHIILAYYPCYHFRGFISA